MADRKADLERRKSIVSRLVRDERTRLQQSQKEFAAFIGLEIPDQPLVSKWELGKTLPWPGDAEMLSRATGIHALSFLGFPYAHVPHVHDKAVVTVVGVIGGRRRRDIYLPQEEQLSFEITADEDRDLTAKVFRVEGNSLAPTYLDGEFIYIAWPSDGRNSLKDGDQVAFAAEDSEKKVMVSIMEYHEADGDDMWGGILRDFPGATKPREAIPARSVNMLGVVIGKLSLLSRQKLK